MTDVEKLANIIDRHIWLCANETRLCADAQTARARFEAALVSLFPPYTISDAVRRAEAVGRQPAVAPEPLSSNTKWIIVSICAALGVAVALMLANAWG